MRETDRPTDRETDRKREREKERETHMIFIVSLDTTCMP